MNKRKKISKKITFGAFAIFLLLIAFVIYSINRKASADLTTEIKKGPGQDQARFQINPKSNWNAPTQVTFRFAAARYMNYAQAYGVPNYQEQSPKVTGRFFCNKPILPGYDYPTGIMETPDAKFEDGAPFPPTDVMDGHNGMTYMWIPGNNYEQGYNLFWSTTVPSTYTHTCTYNQPGEYWPLFYAQGLNGAWYSQKIIVTGTGYIYTPMPSPTQTRNVLPSPSPSPSQTSIANKDLFRAGYTVIGYENEVQTDVFSRNGMKILNYNNSIKNWDIITSGEYLFQAGKAYYVHTEVDKYVDKISAGATLNNPVVRPGWNLIWSEGNSYLGDISLTVFNTSSQCSVKNVPLRYLKEDDMVYRWIYNIVDDKSTVACTAFKLLTGKNQNYSGCSASNPLLNETSYAKAKSGTWVYIWPNKTETWGKKSSYRCY